MSSTPAPLSEDEQYELELAEQARLGADDWMSVKPGKAENFGRSFKRLIGLLRPHAVAFVFVSFLGAIGVVLAVIAPKVLGEATNIIFEGVVGAMLPAGVTQAQAVDQLRASGQNDLANMVSAMHLTPGQGVDFVQLSRVLIVVLALYLAASFLTWVQGYVINAIMMTTMYKLREDVETKINRMPLSYFDKVQRGELISRVTNDIDNITQTMQQSLSTAVTNVLTVVGVLIMMFTISWQLSLVALVSLPLMAVIFGIIGPKSQKAFGIQWRKVG
ncbi:MAG TPA: ABC transporter ATP-binding protein, partial [Microbacteriaceae bacterium]